MAYLYIDEEDALLRLGGNTQVFKMLLKKFLNNSYYDELGQHLADGNLVEAERAAHTIKGTAGNLSLMNLSRAATVLDDILRVEGDYAKAYASLQEIYQETIEEVEEYIS